MPTRHVTDLFSAAYDGALDASEQDRYDRHLATCPECAAAAEQFRQAIDAVHALPRARMPQRVVLPSAPPQLEQRRGGSPLAGLLAGFPRLQVTPAWGAGAMALAGVVAVVLVVRAHVGGPAATSSNSALSQGASSYSLNQGGGAAGAAPLASIGTCPLPLAVVPQPAGLPAEPAGFSAVATATSPQRAGQQLTLATTSRSAAPGSEVLIYAALTTANAGGNAVIPCVSLHNQGALALAPRSSTTEGQSAAGPGAAPATSPSSVPAQPEAGAAVPGTVLSPTQLGSFAPYSVLPWIATASPTAAAVANLPLQVLRIPADATPGTQLQLVALIPSGLPNSTDTPALEAVLTLVVS